MRAKQLECPRCTTGTPDDNRPWRRNNCPHCSGSGVMMDPCEWNPEENRAAFENECHDHATVIVGADGDWRLCEKCAALPEFKRFRKRRPTQRMVLRG